MTADGGERSLGAPRFDVVLRGYDRRQVDEHVARLQRVLARMRADLDAARSQPFPAVGPRPGMGPGGPAGPPGGPQAGPPGGRPRPTPRPRPGQPDSPDMIGSFTDRMQSILQAAEEEADEIRGSAKRDAQVERDSVRKENEGVRGELAELHRQRDAVVAELTRLRGQLEGMLGAPTAKFAVTPPSNPGGGSGRADSAPSAASAPSPSARSEAETPEPRSPRPSPRPKPSPAPTEPRGSADETTAVRRPEAGDLFRPAGESDAGREKPREKPRTVEPDRTVMVSSVQRSGDTGSDEKSTAAPSNTPSDTPDTKSDKAGARAHDEVSPTVKVGAVRPAPAPADGAGKQRNGSSGRGEEPRRGPVNGDRGSAEAPEAATRSDRSSSGSRSG